MPPALAKWIDSTTCKFVELYRSEECLWNAFNVNYRNKYARDVALKNIITQMGIPDFDLVHAKQKIKNLRSTYAQELAKIEHSKRSGNPEDLYVPGLKWFHLMDSFVRIIPNKLSAKNRQDNPVKTVKVDTGENGEVKYLIEYFQGPVKIQPEPQSQAQTQPSVSSSQTPQFSQISVSKDLMGPSEPKRQKLNEVSTSQQEENSNSENGEYEIFGKHIAIQLNKLSVEQSIIAQQEIQSILTRCRLRDIQSSSVENYPNLQDFSQTEYSGSPPHEENSRLSHSSSESEIDTKMFIPHLITD